MNEDESRFLKIWRSGVWNIELFSIPNVPYDSMVKSFGAPDAESDQFDDAPGPAKYWLLEYPCKLKIILQWHGSTNFVIVYADQFEHAHVKQHLGTTLSFHDAWSSQAPREQEIAEAAKSGKKMLPYFAIDRTWMIERLDDNANIFSVAENLTERSATCIARSLEATGHKQSYMARKK